MPSIKKNKIKILFTDIDDTLTDKGRLGAGAYSAIWQLYKKGFTIVPVTGRPAGWCEMIARTWPVAAVIGENGAFYFKYQNQKMQREFIIDESLRITYQKKLRAIESKILCDVPGCALASDQFCRMFDLAIDFCEDVAPLPGPEINKIVDIFHQAGAQAKISSIHVNGWFGTYTKVTTALHYLEKEWGWNEAQAKLHCAFVGDSPNDEPMFEFFPYSYGVANLLQFKNQMKHLPTHIAKNEGGAGFQEIATILIRVHDRREKI